VRACVRARARVCVCVCVVIVVVVCLFFGGCGDVLLFVT